MRKYFLLLIALLCFLKIWAHVPTMIVNGKVDTLETTKPTRSVCLSLGVSYFYRVSGHNYYTLNSRLFIIPRFTFDTRYGFSTNKFGDNKRVHIYTAGFKYWFSNKYCENNFSPFVGLNIYGVLVPDYEAASSNFENYYSMHTIEVPAGISYTTKFGLQTTLQLSYLYWGNSGLKDFLNIELGLGWRFNFRKCKDAKPK